MTHHQKFSKYFSPLLCFVKKVAQEGERKFKAYKKNMANTYYSPLINQCQIKMLPLNPWHLEKKI